MDSSLNNTSWAFIEGLGYKIQNYASGNGLLDNSVSATRYITVPSFTKAFIDVVATYNRTTAWTIRPYLCLSEDIGISKKFYSTWGISSMDGTSFITAIPSLHDDSLPSAIKILSTTQISLCCNNNAGTPVTFYFYIVE